MEAALQERDRKEELAATKLQALQRGITQRREAAKSRASDQEVDAFMQREATLARLEQKGATDVDAFIAVETKAFEDSLAASRSRVAVL